MREWCGVYLYQLGEDCVPAVSVGILCEQYKDNTRGAWCVRSGGVWCNGSGRTPYWRMCW